MRLEDVLITKLKRFVLQNFLEVRTQEDRDTYKRGEAIDEATSKTSRALPKEDHHMSWRGEAIPRIPQSSCIDCSMHNDLIYFKGVNFCVTEIVNNEVSAIGQCKSRQFLKLCESLGFPAEYCNPDDLEKSFMSLIDYICYLSNELITATKASQQFEDALKRYTQIWEIFDEVNSRQVFLEFFQGTRKYEDYLGKTKSFLHVGVGSAKYRAMKLRASITHLQPETDCAKLAAILMEILGEFRSICSGGIWEECKFGCLHVMVPVLTRFRIDPRSKALPDNIQEMVAKVVKYMFDFGKEIINHSNDYGYTSNFEGYHCTVLPKNRKELPQFLLDNLGK